MIKRNINKPLAFVAIFFVLISSAQVSPFNKLKIADTSANYSFIVSGHFHGASTNSSTFPASSLLANIDTLNALQPEFLVSLGDLFLDVNDTYLKHYQSCLFNKLKMPLFNAVGNHDLANGNMYEKIFGKTFFSFKVESQLLVFLNTESNDGNIIGEQLELLKSSLSSIQAENIKQVFVFSHRPIWSEGNPKYKGLFAGNTRSEFGSNNYSTEIYPLISSCSVPVYWISGSMAGGPSSFFIDKDEHSKITYMQTAIRDLPRDAVLQVSVKNNQVSFNGISLTGQALEPIEKYNLDYWKSTIAPEAKFNYRLLPLMTKQMILHWYFWIGVISALIVSLFLRILSKKWKRKE